MSAPSFWEDVATRLSAGRGVFVAVVAAHTKGSPGTAGARLFVDDTGRTGGTVGGGVMEHNLLAEASSWLTDANPAPVLQRRVHRRDAGAQASGLICAGEQVNVLMCLGPGRAAEVLEYAASLARDAPVTLTVDASGVRFESGTIGAAGLVDETLPGWCFREHGLSRRRVAIVGAGHCGQAVARLAASVGYHVTLFDHREDRLAAVPAALVCCVPDYADVATRLDHAETTTVLVMTSGLDTDVATLVGLAQTPTRRLGVMGSRHKIRVIRDSLAERGVNRAVIDAIQGPIGLAIKSDTPAEIAVSVVAELLAREDELRTRGRIRAHRKRY